jgi:hypothetical protein
MMNQKEIDRLKAKAVLSLDLDSDKKTPVLHEEISQFAAALEKYVSKQSGKLFTVVVVGAQDR